MESPDGVKVIQVDNDNGYKEFVIDTVADLSKLPTKKFFGSAALCLETSDVYVLNTKGEWIKIG